MKVTATDAPPSTSILKVEFDAERSVTASKDVLNVAPRVDAPLAVNFKNSMLVKVSVPSAPPDVTVVVLPTVLIV